MRRPIRYLAYLVALFFGISANAAGIDSRAFSCADLHRVIESQGFVFISQPAFGDFVVSGPYYCGGGQTLRLRSVRALDRSELPRQLLRNPR